GGGRWRGRTPRLTSGTPYAGPAGAATSVATSGAAGPCRIARSRPASVEARIGAVSGAIASTAGTAATSTGTASRSRAFETENTTTVETIRPSAPPLLWVRSQPQSAAVAPPSAIERTATGASRRAATAAAGQKPTSIS